MLHKSASLFFKKGNRHRILLLVIGLVAATLGIIIYVIPPGVDPDPCWGFLVMHGMETGHPFNMLISPDPHNIAYNHNEFLAWWSPGQYLVPYFFKLFFKINTGHAVSITIFLCSLSGILGLYRLFVKLGFSKWIAAISVAFIITQLFFVAAFRYYNGGETLLFAFSGWFIYGCFSFRKINWQALLFVFFAGLLGFLSKSSVLWMFAAGVACLWINISINEKMSGQTVRPSRKLPHDLNINIVKKWFLNGLLLAIPFVAAIAVIYIGYLSKGANPTSDPANFMVKPQTFTYPLASPLLSAFSVDELVDGLLYQPDGSNVSYHTALIIIVISACCSLVFLYFINKLSVNRRYKLAVTALYLTGVLFFSYMFFKQVNISYEGRHFRILGLLFIPGLIWLCFSTRTTQLLFFAIWSFYIYTSFNFLRNELSANRHAARGNSGLSQQGYDNATLNAIVKLDRDHSNHALFVVMCPDIAIEVVNNRVITFDDDTPDAEFLTMKYIGKAGTLYMLVPESYVNSGKDLIISRCFINYHHFERKQLGKEFCLLSAEN